MDWLSGINLDDAHNLILKEYKILKFKGFSNNCYKTHLDVY